VFSDLGTDVATTVVVTVAAIGAMMLIVWQGTEAELQVHSAERVSHHLELSVMHTAETGLGVATVRRQTQVNTNLCNTLPGLINWLLIDWLIHLFG